MTSFERMTKRMNGKGVDKIPNFNIYMTFASRYIDQPLSKYYLDYKVLVEANLSMVENFDVDIVQAISDPYRETYDFGAQIDFPSDDLPISKTPLLGDPDQIKSIIKPNPSSGKRMSDRLEAIRLMKEKVGNDIPVMGWVEGALAEAGNLRGVSNLLMDLYERPDWVKELLEIVTEVEIKFAIEQINAGADIIGLGDALASQISPDQYQEFALPYETRIFDMVKMNGAIPRLHICGNTSPILSLMVNSGASIIDLDWMVDINYADKIYGNQISFCGNVDPVAKILNGSEKEVIQATKNIITNRDSKVICAGGCEIPMGTPPANLIAQNKALYETNMETKILKK